MSSSSCSSGSTVSATSCDWGVHTTSPGGPAVLAERQRSDGFPGEVPDEQDPDLDRPAGVAAAVVHPESERHLVRASGAGPDPLPEPAGAVAAVARQVDEEAPLERL